MKQLLLVILFTLCLHTISLAQNQVVTGQVSSSAGEPLPGVNVAVEGTNMGTVTDAQGNYKIRVSESESLIFSFVGFETVEKPVQGKSTIDVTLKFNSRELGEAVVTAMGISQVKEKIGYSTQQIELQNIENTAAPNLGNLFTGQVAGLTVNNPTGLFQGASFSLRGKKPLIVIDDIPVNTDLFDISKNDIKEINVLKGTAASALYGARGKDGAILITTKNARREGLSINVSNSTMISAGYTVFPEYQDEYGNGSNGQYEFWDGRGGGISDGDMIWGPKFDGNKEIAQWNSPIRDTQTGEVVPWYGTVEGTKYDDKQRYERVPIPWKSYDNIKEFMRTGFINETEFSVAYSGDNARYRFSGNYAKQQGQVPNTSLDRGGFTFKSSFNLSDNLTLDNKLSYNKVYSPNYPAYGYGPNNHIYTLLVWQGADVNPDALRNNLWVPGREGFKQANWNYAWYNNPYFGAFKREQEQDENVYRGQIRLKWDITDNLSVQGRSSANLTDLFRDQKRPKSYLRYGDPRDGFYKTWNSNATTIDNDLRLNYKLKPSALLGLNFNVGANSFTQMFEEYYNSTDGLVVPGVYSLNNTNRNPSASSLLRKKSIRSLYATVDVELMDAFFFNFSGRNDWSSALPESNNSYFYPSASLSTMVSNLLNLPTMMDYLKVYGSWAEVSSDLDPNFNNPYQTTAYYRKSGDFNGNPQLYYPAGIVNPNIEPQKSTSTEIGVSVGMLQNSLNFDVTYYNVVDENQIINLPISPASGFQSRKVNGNEYTTNGLEVMLNTYPVQGETFSWDLSVNWSKRVTRLTDIYGDNDQFNNLEEGDRADSYYATGWMKSPDGQVILDAATGLPTKDPDPQFKGYKNPNSRFGLQNELHYNDFTLNVAIDGAVGGVMRSLTVEKMWWGGKHPNSTKWRDEEYAAGEPVFVPEGVNLVEEEFVENTTAVSWQTWAQNYPYRAKVTQEESEEFANIFDRSFAKLRNVSLTYDMTRLFTNAGLEKVTLTAFGYNLAIIKSAEIIDPDFGNDDNLQDPSTRYVGLKANVTF